MARILPPIPDVLARTDIADHALESVTHAVIQEVVIVGAEVRCRCRSPR